jgi:hypothetical protein
VESEIINTETDEKELNVARKVPADFRKLAQDLLKVGQGAPPPPIGEGELAAMSATSLEHWLTDLTTETSTADKKPAHTLLLEFLGDHASQVRKAPSCQKLGQLQPVIAVFPQECMGQLAYFGLT